MTRIYQFGDEVICHDPGPEMIPFFKQLDPNYCLESKLPQKGFRPKFQMLRDSNITTDRKLFEMNELEIKTLLQGGNDESASHESNCVYSKLDLLYVLALKSMSDCNLCGWQCDCSNPTMKYIRRSGLDMLRIVTKSECAGPEVDISTSVLQYRRGRFRVVNKGSKVWVPP